MHFGHYKCVVRQGHGWPLHPSILWFLLDPASLLLSLFKSSNLTAVLGHQSESRARVWLMVVAERCPVQPACLYFKQPSITPQALQERSQNLSPQPEPSDLRVFVAKPGCPIPVAGGWSAKPGTACPLLLAEPQPVLGHPRLRL